jgi:probable HAF family extracellular repeat protein
MRKTACLVVFSALSMARADGAERVRKYRLHDVGTLGGALSLFYNFDQVSFVPAPLNEHGQLAVTSLTGAGLASGAEWSNGALRALPNLPNANVGGGGSNANGINDAGVIVGAADDGVINPRNGKPFDHAVWWDRAGIHRLPELGGNASFANFVTERGLIVGFANNAVPDPYTYAGTQTRAVLWQDGVAHDLGTLGGTDSTAFLASECEREDEDPRVRVIGTSSLATAAGPPFGIPQTDAFVWSDGVMKDLGNLGGGFSTPSDINCRGQVIVISFDATNQHFQSFLWTDGRQVLLKPLGGHFVEAVALNDRGRIAGAVSDTTDQSAIAVVWGPSGDGRLLGTIGADSGSIALDVNARGVIVGGSGTVSFTAVASYAHAFVGHGDGAIEDLNTLIPAGSSLTLNVAYVVNDRGNIAGLGTSAAGETHAFILSPDDSDDGEDLRRTQ